MFERAALGLFGAAAIAFAARRARSLSTSGAIAATFIGAASVAAGWGWGALLIAYFVSSSLLSHVGRARKAVATAGVVAKSGARDATQVLANGGLFAACLLLAPLASSRFAVTMMFAALGALAASAADTWSTEIGTLLGGAPRSILSMKKVPAGTSGGVSAAGTLAMVAGAVAIAALGRVLGLPHDIVIVSVAGIGGAVADSLLGATLQERRWCPQCGRTTEVRVHECGTSTLLAGGREWADNDLVNLLATFVGAAVAAVLVNV